MPLKALLRRFTAAGTLQTDRRGAVASIAATVQTQSMPYPTVSKGSALAVRPLNIVFITLPPFIFWKQCYEHITASKQISFTLIVCRMCTGEAIRTPEAVCIRLHEENLLSGVPLHAAGIVRAAEIVNAFPGDEGLRQFRAWALAPDYDLIADAAASPAERRQKRREASSGGGDVPETDAAAGTCPPPPHGVSILHRQSA